MDVHRRHRRFVSAIFGGVAIWYLFGALSYTHCSTAEYHHHAYDDAVRSSDDDDGALTTSASADDEQLLFHDHRTIADMMMTADATEQNLTTLSVQRVKRQQWGCPNGCYSPCVNNAHCQQRYQLATVCVLGCCCPAATMATNLSTACDGDAAVAACLNGLCGQGYFCNARNFCCRCQSGTSPGECVNNMCPAGYACNTNNYCCSIGSGSLLAQCINGQCPVGYVCGAGNLCYPVTGNSGPPALPDGR